jgi:hypothetical protein
MYTEVWINKYSICLYPASQRIVTDYKQSGSFIFAGKFLVQNAPFFLIRGEVVLY